MSALPTDFNDLAAAQGLAAVSEQLEPVIQGVADWPAPILTAAEPAPLTADLLPAWLGRYVGALAEATQTPATMSALFALSVVSACVHERRSMGLIAEAVRRTKAPSRSPCFVLRKPKISVLSS